MDRSESINDIVLVMLAEMCNRAVIALVNDLHDEAKRLDGRLNALGLVWSARLASVPFEKAVMQTRATVLDTLEGPELEGALDVLDALDALDALDVQDALDVLDALDELDALVALDELVGFVEFMTGSDKTEQA